MTDIFLSYSSEDREWVRCLANKLASVGFSVWWDRNIPAGKTFTAVITEALDGARCVVAVWSENSIKSNWVREEAEEGLRRSILVPVLMHAVSPPLGFRSIQAVDLSAWDREEDTREFQKLVDDIALVVGPPKIPMAKQQPSVDLGRQAPSPPATTFLPKVEEVAATRPPDEAYRPSLVEQRSELKTTPYILVGVVVALVAGVLVGANYAFYWREFGGFSFGSFVTSSLYALGLYASLEMGNRLSGQGPVKKALITAGAVVALGMVLGVVLVALPWSRPTGDPLIALLGWTTISIFAVVVITKPKARRTDTSSHRFWWAVLSGATGGAIWATLVAGISGDFAILVSHDWLKFFADGIPLGALIGFVESVGPD
jgi:hypothetical protein